MLVLWVVLQPLLAVLMRRHTCCVVCWCPWGVCPCTTAVCTHGLPATPWPCVQARLLARLSGSGEFPACLHVLYSCALLHPTPALECRRQLSRVLPQLDQRLAGTARHNQPAFWLFLAVFDCRLACISAAAGGLPGLLLFPNNHGRAYGVRLG